MESDSPRPSTGLVYVSFDLIALTIAGIGYAIFKPARSIQDRMAGTVLVPA